MVAQFLRLRLQLLANSFVRSPLQVLWLVLALLYGLSITALAILGLVGARFVAVADAAVFIVIGGSLVTLGFILVPLVFGVDDAMDPRKFSLFGIDNDKVAIAVAASALVSVPSLMVVLVALATIVSWSRDAASIVISIPAAALIVITSVLSARVVTAAASLLLTSRRAREWLGAAGLLVVVLASPAFVVLFGVDWGTDGFVVASRVAGVLAWTPLGAVWAAPASVASGQVQEGLAQLLIAVAFAVLLWRLWTWLVGQLMVAPEQQSESRSYPGLGWFDHLPADPTGAIAARSLTYWARDPRYRVSLVMVPVVPVLVFVPLYIAGVPVEYLYLLPLPVMCLFLGWSLHNDIAFDNTAFWLHLASGVSGRSDRLGRLVPVLVWAVPLIIVGSVVTAWLYGDWSVVASLIGVSWALVGAGLGLSSVLSVAFPYAAVRPGESPFQQPQNTGVTGALVQTLSFFVSLLLAAPVITLAVVGIVSPGIWEFASLVAGLVIGTGTLVAGVRSGAAVYQRRGPEVLAFAQSF